MASREEENRGKYVFWEGSATTQRRSVAAAAAAPTAAAARAAPEATTASSAPAHPGANALRKMSAQPWNQAAIAVGLALAHAARLRTSTGVPRVPA